MADADLESIEQQFRQSLGDCQRLYLSSARHCIDHFPTLLPQSPQHFLDLMDDLHHGLLVKVYSTVMEADRRSSAEEIKLAAILFKHIWNQELSGDRLREAMQHVLQQGRRLSWYSLIRPFDRIAPLRQRVGELETVVLRVANLVAKCDGVVTDTEAKLLRSIEGEIALHLRPIPLDEPGQHEQANRDAAEALVQMQKEKPQVREQHPSSERAARHKESKVKSAEERLAEALAELHEMIGMDNVKQQVSTLTNYLKMQQQRTSAGLPTTSLSLHMVFTGNPGTGKTSVARIVGKIFGAMGILKKGHLVETDRSGLVAKYAGQTAPKTNEKINEALDGVLFIDEAYSLVAESAEDAFGREAVQTLLKRMEDDRQRLVVILAGYPEPIDALLRSNPGLSSRFSTNLNFDDYRPGELGRIFQSLCDKNQYQVPGATQAKLLLGLRWLYDQRDEHFGNGRLVRNVFELAIRRLANRIADVVPVTKELLSVIQPQDVELPDVPPDVLAKAGDDQQRFLVICGGCSGNSYVPVAFLGKRVKCNACGHRFKAAWGEPQDLPA
jgi:SpoVK/Ycf46/Vps4 family AAA+-type ATPase